MNPRGLRRYVDGLLAGHQPKPFQADDFEAAQIRTAIELQAARLGADGPRQEFLTDLHRRLAEQMEPSADTPQPARRWPTPTRRQVLTGTSAAAAAAAVGVTADRLLRSAPPPAGEVAATADQIVPTDGSWQVVAASSDVPDGAVHRFDLGSVVGFVRRVDGRAEAVSGVCTHQGCRLWFDGPDDRLRCPCHATSFSPDGQVLTHQLPIAPNPLPRFQVREQNGNIEVLAPARPPAEPA